MQSGQPAIISCQFHHRPWNCIRALPTKVSYKVRVKGTRELLASCSQYVTKLLGGSEAPSNP